MHNTAWIPAHFHLTVAGPVFLGILGMSLYILLGITGKKLQSPKLAMFVPYLWMIGVLTMSTGQFIGSFKGEPRRTNMGMIYLDPQAPNFRPDWVAPTFMAAIGGIVMTLAVVLYFYVLVQSLISESSAKNAEFQLPLGEAYHNEDIAIVKTLTPWILGAVLLAFLAYAPPIYQILQQNNPGGLKFAPDNPVPLIEKIK